MCVIYDFQKIVVSQWWLLLLLVLTLVIRADLYDYVSGKIVVF
jgi:hypothetical protein